MATNLLELFSRLHHLKTTEEISGFYVACEVLLDAAELRQLDIVIAINEARMEQMILDAQEAETMHPKDEE